MASPRHLKPRSRRTAVPSAIALFVALSAVATLTVVFLGSGRGQGPPPAPTPSASPVPHFAFRVARVQPIPTGSKKTAGPAARAAAARIGHTLDSLYLAGFLDPNAWRRGSYGGAWRAFASEAVTQAQVDEPTLTLGPRAGAVFRSVRAHTAIARVRVLVDRLGHPSTAEAAVRFAARGVRADGVTQAIRSTGHYFLRPSARGWVIYAYDVKRDDAEFPPATPQPSSTGAA